MKDLIFCLRELVNQLWPRKAPTVQEFSESVRPSDSKVDCRSCRNHYGQIDGGNFLVCAIHPDGKSNCPDWEARL